MALYLIERDEGVLESHTRVAPCFRCGALLRSDDDTILQHYGWHELNDGSTQ
jgi:hypothetical protein